MGFVSQLLQLDRKLHPVVLVLANERFQLVAEPAVENRVLVQVDLAVFADGVLHLAGLGLGIGLAGEVLGEAGVGDLDGGDGRVDALAHQVVVDQLAHLLAHASQGQRAVLGALLDLRQDVAKAASRYPVGIGSAVGQDDVEALQELLEVDLEIGPHLDVLEQIQDAL